MFEEVIAKYAQRHLMSFYNDEELYHDCIEKIKQIKNFEQMSPTDWDTFVLVGVFGAFGNFKNDQDQELIGRVLLKTNNIPVDYIFMRMLWAAGVNFYTDNVGFSGRRTEERLMSNEHYLGLFKQFCDQHDFMLNMQQVDEAIDFLLKKAEPRDQAEGFKLLFDLKRCPEVVDGICYTGKEANEALKYLSGVQRESPKVQRALMRYLFSRLPSVDSWEEYRSLIGVMNNLSEANYLDPEAIMEFFKDKQIEEWLGQYSARAYSRYVGEFLSKTTIPMDRVLEVFGHSSPPFKIILSAQDFRPINIQTMKKLFSLLGYEERRDLLANERLSQEFLRYIQSLSFNYDAKSLLLVHQLPQLEQQPFVEEIKYLAKNSIKRTIEQEYVNIANGWKYVEAKKVIVSFILDAIVQLEMSDDFLWRLQGYWQILNCW